MQKASTTCATSRVKEDGMFSAHAYVEQAIRTYNFLCRQTDLSPRNPLINQVLSSFVRATMKERRQEEIDAILGAKKIAEIAPELRRLTGRAEYEMECYCAAAMAGDIPDAPKGYSSYAHFLYRDNYAALIESELQAMKWETKCPPIKADRESVAFVGAGPLPISAIMFSNKTGLPVTCVDSDETACRLGQKLIRHLAATDPECAGLDQRIRFANAAGEEHDYVTHPIVFIASLIERKDPVMTRIVQTSHTVATTIVRSAEGLSTLLYQPEDTKAGLEEYNVYLTGQSKHSPEAINTSLIFKFPPGKMYMRNKANAALVQEDGLDRLQPSRRWLSRSTLAEQVPI